MYNDYFGEGGASGERVSHQALDVAAWEEVGVEVQRQNCSEQQGGYAKAREWPRQQGNVAPTVSAKVLQASAIES